MNLRRLRVALAGGYLLLMLPARNLAQEPAREPRLVITAFDADTAQHFRNRPRWHRTRQIESRSYRTDQTRSGPGRQASNGKVHPLPQELSRTIVQIALQEGVDHMFILEIMRQESGFCRTARSSKNAHGLMQFIPSTARRFGVRNPNDPVEAITGACRYIKYLASLSYIHNDPSLVLAGYNAGEGAVRLAGGHVPAISETRQYVASIMAGYRRARTRDLGDAPIRCVDHGWVPEGTGTAITDLRKAGGSSTGTEESPRVVDGTTCFEGLPLCFHADSADGYRRIPRYSRLRWANRYAGHQPAPISA
jgi:hypothetical protein